MTDSAYNPCQLYSNSLVSHPTQSSICTVSYLYFRYCLGNLGNLSTAFLFACNGGACVTESGLITKKGELPKTSLHLSDVL